MARLYDNAPPVAAAPATSPSIVLAALQLVRVGLRPHVLFPDEKRPADKDWEKNTDYSADAVRARFELASENCGIGVRTGDGLIVLDVDGDEGLASMNALVEKFGALPATVTCITRSGGLHLYFRVPVGTLVKNSVSALGPKLDVRGDGGQVVVPPTAIGGKVYTWAPGCAPDEVAIAGLPKPWLAAILALKAPAAEPVKLATPSGTALRSSGDRALGLRRARAYLAKLDPSISGEGGHSALFSAACRAVELTLCEEDALQALAEYNERAAPPWDEADLSRKVREALKHHALGERFDEPAPAAATDATLADTAASPAPTTAAARRREVLERVSNVESSPLIKVIPFGRFMRRDPKTGAWDLRVALNRDAAADELVRAGLTAAEAKRAMSDRVYPQAVDIVCEPGMGSSFVGPHGLVINTYVEPTIRTAPGEFPVLQAVLDFVCDDDASLIAWLTAWASAAVRFPGQPLRTIPVLFGASRTGKSLFVRALSELVGVRNCSNVRSDDLANKFNVHVVTKLLVHASELSGGDKPGVTEKLKYLTGEPVLNGEPKGATPAEFENRLKILISSNMTLPVLVEHGDTRFAMFYQPAEPSVAYSKMLLTLFDSPLVWSERGRAEVAAFGHYLKHADIDLSIIKNPPASAARTATIDTSANSVVQFLKRVDSETVHGVFSTDVNDGDGDPAWKLLDVDGYPELTGLAALYELYRRSARRNSQEPMSRERFRGEMSRAFPSWEVLDQGGGVDRRPAGIKFSTVRGPARNPSLVPTRYRPFAAPTERTQVPISDAPAAVQAAQQVLLDEDGAPAVNQAAPKERS